MIIPMTFPVYYNLNNALRIQLLNEEYNSKWSYLWAADLVNFSTEIFDDINIEIDEATSDFLWIL
jgi:hypothetical protein